MHSEAIHPAVRVGHVHLRVADLDRALGFYRDALGFGVSADARGAGLDMVLLAAGDYHHHIGLNSRQRGRRRRRPAYRPLPRRVPVPRPARARPRGAPAARPRLPDRPRHRPRRHRLGLPRRPRRQRHRALLRPPARRLVRRRRPPDLEGRPLRLPRPPASPTPKDPEPNVRTAHRRRHRPDRRPEASPARGDRRPIVGTSGREAG